MKTYDYIIYCEGGYKKDVGLGAYAVIVLDGKDFLTKEIRTAFVSDTDSMRIYLEAIKSVIDTLPYGASVQIRSDCEYAVKVLGGKNQARKNIDIIGRIWNTTRVMELNVDYLWCSEQHGDLMVIKCWRLCRDVLKSL